MDQPPFDDQTRPLPRTDADGVDPVVEPPLVPRDEIVDPVAQPIAPADPGYVPTPEQDAAGVHGAPVTPYGAPGAAYAAAAVPAGLVLDQATGAYVDGAGVRYVVDPQTGQYVPAEPPLVEQPLPLELRRNSAGWWIIALALLLALAALAIWAFSRDDNKKQTARRPVVTRTTPRTGTTPRTTPAPTTTKPTTPTSTTPKPAATTPTTPKPATTTPTPAPVSPQPTAPAPSNNKPASPTFAQLAGDPASYSGKPVSVKAPAGPMVNDTAFVAQQGSDRVLVVPDAAPQQGMTYTISGTAGVVDDAFRQAQGEAFFRDIPYDQLQGLAVISLAQLAAG